MTEGFKDFVMGMSLLPLVILAGLLFIPTLGHSVEWFEKVFAYYCKVRPQTFSKG